MKKNSLIRMTAGALSLTMALGMISVIPARAATEHWNDASSESASWKQYKENWETLSNNYENVSLTPGSDQTKLNYAWYSKTQETPKVKIGTKQDMSDAKEYSGTQAKNTDEDIAAYYANKVTVSDLKENTTYYYQVFQNGNWQSVKKYKTNSFSNFSFFYVGDPQIGASKKQTDTEGNKMNSKDGGAAEENLAGRNDAYNWDKTLKNAVANHPDASFLVSAGDQVNSSKNEREYAGYLSAQTLASLPVATTIGNHDSTSSRYSSHFNNPNNFNDARDTTYTEGRTAAGTDYYYRYGDALFIVLDTNNYNCATHENVIKKAVDENKDAKWRIVTFHQDIYGSGYDHSDSDGIVLRTQLTPIFDKYDIDVALQGHDHTYSRTYQLTGDGKQHASYDNQSDHSLKYYSANPEEQKKYLSENNCYAIKSDVKGGTVVNPEGTVYFEANSATGSKFYNLIASQQDYIAERSQTWQPSYSVVNVSENALSVTTYDAKTGAVMEGSSTYTIVKEADKKSLKEEIKNAEEKVKDNNYTTDSVKAVKEAAQAAQKVAEDKNAASKEIEAKTADLVKAVAALTVKAEQTVTATDSYSKQVGDKAFALDAKTSGKGTLSYTSSNEDVALVSSKGIVRIIGEGQADITVTASATDAEKQADKKVSVKVAKAPATTAAPATTTAVPATTTAAPATTTAAPATTTAAASKDKKTSEKKKSTSKKVTVSKIRGVKASALKNGIKVSYKKSSKVSGYEISYSDNEEFTKNVNIIDAKKSVKPLKIKKLTKGNTYYIRVRAYKKSSGQSVYGDYSKVTKVTVK